MRPVALRPGNRRPGNRRRGGRRCRGGAPGAAAAQPGEFLDQAGGAEAVAGDFRFHRAAFEHQDAVGQPGEEFQILLDQQQGEAATGPDRRQRLRHLLDDRRLDAFGRLVEQEQHRIGDQAARDCENLLFAAAEHAALAVEQRDQARKVGDDPVDTGVGAGVAGFRAPGEMQVFAHREVGEDAPALGDIAEAEPAAPPGRQPRDLRPFEADLSAGRRQQAHQGLEQGRFAHAVVAEQAEHLVLGKVHRHAAQYGNVAVAGAQLVDREDCIAPRIRAVRPIGDRRVAVPVPLRIRGGAHCDFPR